MRAHPAARPGPAASTDRPNSNGSSKAAIEQDRQGWSLPTTAGSAPASMGEPEACRTQYALHGNAGLWVDLPNRAGHGDGWR